ncbi:MAG: hypothetical protein V1685_01760 [Parcubacteria group bacterium]
MLKANLEGTPRPHYLQEAEIDDGGHHLVGKVLFPSSDPTVGDRKDHVNVSHHLFAAWNAAHLLAKNLFGGARLWAKKVTTTLHEITLPDVPIRIEADLTFEREHGRHRWGHYQVTFHDESGQRLLAELEVQFVCEIVQ